ncbi:MAG: hypothetical protein K2L25_01605 [Alphaproteobacteria bacterium]|nr:hypothetical protein [Alphaproteobacteria bacterium]
MESNKTVLSSIEFRPKHRALTKLMRCNWERGPMWWQAILSKCTVAPYLGALPPELRARVTKEQLSAVTHQFRMILEDFLIANIHDIQKSSEGGFYYIDDIGKLFGTQCTLEFPPISYFGYRMWSGRFGMVGKISFPELGGYYALKLFYKLIDSEYCGAHGVEYEIPTAFAAAHAEPRDNSRVYMASLIYEPYLLSRWEGDVAGACARENENEIFVTAPYEEQSRNYRHGRRIDYGETYRTAYGAASYRVRKMCRTIMNAAKRNDVDSLRRLAQDASVAAPAAQKDFCKAMDLAAGTMCIDIYGMITNSVGPKTY